MSDYQSPHEVFVFESYDYDLSTQTALFKYSFDSKRFFTETVTFSDVTEGYNQPVLERALKLAFLVAGSSYYKSFPTKRVVFKNIDLTSGEADLLQRVYTEGLSQFIFENDLSVEDIATFEPGSGNSRAVSYDGQGMIALQSGGKDSLLMATLLDEVGQKYTAEYISSSESHPGVLDDFQTPLRIIRRNIDREGLKQATADGGLNGHVPVTYIVESYALIDAILHNEHTVVASIGAEGAEPHEFVGELTVNHQWSKTWEAEQLFANYVTSHISSSLQVGSPLRMFSELRIAELFVEKCWQRFGHTFSSCNRANYQQGANNTTLKWCGECPKCANSYLLFAPFVEPDELKSLFNGQDLFAKALLTQTFKGLLGIDGVMKPFECVGETEELRLAYQMAREKYGADAYQLPFEVPNGQFDYKRLQPAQAWAKALVPAVY